MFDFAPRLCAAYTCLVFILLLCATWPCAGARADAQPPSREEAIKAALRWLAKQQREDGGWSFDARDEGGARPAASSTEATGLALLAFFGAGQTQKDGDYKKQVHAGLKFLIRRMKVEERRGDLRGRSGDMIAHAVAALALGEAFALTHDKELLEPAQMAVNFSMAQQDEKSGGWRADAMARASVEATGWQLLALKTAHAAYLAVKPQTVLSAQKYFSDVQLDEGCAYPGRDGKREHRATAIGLYCRYILGWKPRKPALVEGLAALGRGGPQQHDAVANYFAHRLHHACLGDAWKPWSEAIVKQLLQSQVCAGEHAGSWYDDREVSAARGGRLLQTAINAMILEIDVRGRDLLPKVDDDEFPL